MTTHTATIVSKTASTKPTVTEIWVHRNLDIDEVIALWILINFGKLFFPGVESATIHFVDPAMVDSTYEELLAKGILCVGFGGGPFDEHAEAKRPEDTSAASLVATALGVRYSTGVRQQVDYAVEKDHSTATGKKELALLVKSAFRFLLVKIDDADERDTKIMDILAAAFILLDADCAQEKAFEDCALDYAQERNETFFVKPDGKHLRIVSVISSNPEMQKYCRTENGGYAGVVIQRQKSGHTQIHFDHRQVDKDLTARIIKLIRITERRNNGCFGHLSCDELMADKCVEGAECWYYEYDKRLILNGSLTQSKPPTSLSRDLIEILVIKAIEGYFA